MIWNSVPAMTAFDITIVGCVALSLAVYHKRMRALTPAWYPRGSIAFMSGLAIIGLFYAADLASMHILPRFIGYADATRVMAYLHLNVEWLTTSVAIVCLAAGLLWLSRASAELVGTLQMSRADLASELERHKQSNEALRASEERFALAVRGTDDGIWDWNIKTHGDYFSPRWKDILGYADDELEPHIDTFAELIHPDDRDRVWQAVESHLARRAPYDIEMRLRHKEGAYIWVRARGQAVWDENGEPFRMAGSITDITENKRLARILRDSESRLANAQRIAHLGNWDWNIVDNTLWWSDEIYRIFGLKPHQFAANYQAFLATVHPDDRALVETAVDATLAGREPYSIEHRIVLPDGSIRIVHERAEVTFDDAGRPTRMAGTVHDITERKQAETQLAHFQKLESVERLTGGVAHDFNNLLTVVTGNLELLSGRTDDPQARQYVERAMKSALHGAELIQRLLAYSRRQALTPTVVRANDTVAGIASMLARVLPETIEVRTEIAPDLWRIKIDAGQLESALMNLVTNASDAMPSGGVLTIQTDNMNVVEDETRPNPGAAAGNPIEPGDYVRIKVSDTGHGMPDYVLKQATEPFFTTKDVGKGSGLGLSMVYGFIRQSGGDMLLESKAGVGTTISLFLPRRLEAAAPKRVQTGNGREGRGEKILLVEDDPGVRDLTSELLRDMGYSVISVADGEEAMRALKQHAEFDLLLTDIVLPGQTSGLGIAREAAKTFPRVGILLMSGYSEDTAGIDREELGTMQFITKPFVRQGLAQALSAALQDSDQEVPP